jgi:hypothetical protein
VRKCVSVRINRFREMSERRLRLLEAVFPIFSVPACIAARRSKLMSSPKKFWGGFVAEGMILEQWLGNIDPSLDSSLASLVDRLLKYLEQMVGFDKSNVADVSVPVFL